MVVTDADWEHSPLNLQFLNYLTSGATTHIHCFPRPLHARTLHITAGDQQRFVQTLATDIANGLKVFVGCGTIAQTALVLSKAAKAQDVANLTQFRNGNKLTRTIGVYTSESGNNELNDLRNVNQVWRSLTLVVATTRAAVGLSYDHDDFDRVYLFVAAQGALVREMLQLSLRVRKPKDTTIRVFVDCLHSNCSDQSMLQLESHLAKTTAGIMQRNKSCTQPRPKCIPRTIFMNHHDANMIAHLNAHAAHEAYMSAHRTLQSIVDHAQRHRFRITFNEQGGNDQENKEEQADPVEQVYDALPQKEEAQYLLDLAYFANTASMRDKLYYERQQLEHVTGNPQLVQALRKSYTVFKLVKRHYHTMRRLSSALTGQPIPCQEPQRPHFLGRPALFKVPENEKVTKTLDLLRQVGFVLPTDLGNQNKVWDDSVLSTPQVLPAIQHLAMLLKVRTWSKKPQPRALIHQITSSVFGLAWRRKTKGTTTNTVCFPPITEESTLYDWAVAAKWPGY